MVGNRYSDLLWTYQAGSRTREMHWTNGAVMSESSRDQQAQAILHAYLQAVDTGQTPDREELLRQHPAFATELREFFADQAKMDGLARSLHREIGRASCRERVKTSG